MLGRLEEKDDVLQFRRQYNVVRGMLRRRSYQMWGNKSGGLRKSYHTLLGHFESRFSFYDEKY
jgi:hypothetical protein